MTLWDVGYALVAGAVAYGIGLLIEQRRFARARPLRMTVSDSSLEIIEPQGKVLVAIEPVIEFVQRPMGLPQITNFGKISGPVESFSLTDLAIEKPPRNLLNGFVIACCIEARRKLHLKSAHRLVVDLDLRLADEPARAWFLRHVRHRQLRTLGIRLRQVSRAVNTASEP